MKKDFIAWIRTVINPQAKLDCNNSAALDDFSADGNLEYCYPEKFKVSGNQYLWTVSLAHTRGRSLCTHYEIWFFGPAFGAGKRIATGAPTKAKIQKGLRVIFDFYEKEAPECMTKGVKENG